MLNLEHEKGGGDILLKCNVLSQGITHVVKHMHDYFSTAYQKPQVK